MQKSIFINLFIKKSSTKRSLLNYITLILIFTILFSFSLLLKTYENNKLRMYDCASYSLWINHLDKKHEPKVKEIFGDNYKGATIFSDNFYSSKGKTCHTDLYVTDSFVNSNLTSFSDKLIIKSKDIDESLNPIYIDKTMADFLNVTTGDKVYQKWGREKTEVEFTVSRIYEPLNPMKGYGSALALWENKQKELYESSFNNLNYYSVVYVKYDNLNDAANLIKTKIGKSPIVYRKDELNSAIEDLKFTPATILLTSVLGFIVLIIFTYKESTKWITNNLRNISIVNCLGISKKSLVTFMFFKNVLSQTILFIISCLIVKFVVYDMVIKSLYLNIGLLLHFFIAVELFQIIASFLSSIWVYYKLSKLNLSTLLIKE